MRAIAGTKLDLHLLEMAADRFLANTEKRRDFIGAPTKRDEPKNRELARRYGVVGLTWSFTDELLEPLSAKSGRGDQK